MTYAELVEQVKAEFPEVQTGKMFDMDCLKLRGKALGGEWQGNVVVKLSPERAETALATIAESHQFEPMPGHAMRQWVVVPEHQGHHWLRLMREAVADRLAL